MRGRYRAWVLAALLLMCWSWRATARESTSEEQSLLSLTEAQIVSMLEPQAPYSAGEIAWLVLDLQAEARAEINRTAEEAAAAAVRPVLAMLAEEQARAARWRTAAFVGFVAAGGLFLGLVFGR